MPSTFSKNLRIELPSDGSLSGLWGRVTNRNLGTLLEQAITGNVVINVADGDVILTTLNGLSDQSRNAVLIFEGSNTNPITVEIPNLTKKYTVINRSDTTVSIQSKTVFNVPYSSEAYIYNDSDGVINGKVIAAGAQGLLANQAPFNNPSFTGTVLAPTPARGSVNNQVATTKFVHDALPVGSVIMWYGDYKDVPYGFVICDGNNGTPNLVDKFVVCAGNKYSLGDTGGVDSVTLTEEQIPGHTHTGDTDDASVSHTHSVDLTTESDGEHTHDGGGTTETASTQHTHKGTTKSNNRGHSHSGTTGSQDRSHFHPFGGTTDGAGAHSHNLQFRNGGQGPSSNAVPGSQGTSIGYVSGAIGSVGNHSHTVSGNTGGESRTHRHDFTTGTQSANHEHDFTTGNMSGNASHSHTYSFTTDSDGKHKHGVSGDTSDSTNTTHNHPFTTNSTGGGNAHENRPPYVALFYIMKVV